jgi:DNA-binding CsgD family transcriptional regulator
MTQDPSAGVVICDLDGKVVWGNERCFRIYLGPEARPGDVIGKTWEELGFPRAWIDERLAMFREIKRSGEPVLLRTIWRGSQVLAWIYPLPPDGECEQDCFLVVSRISEADIKELGQDVTGKVMVSGVARLGELDVLSPRELEVLALLGQGLTIKEIAKILFRSEKTIGRHRDSIGAKLGLSNKVDLAEVARRAGLTVEDVGRERV